jgi:hypothetical protein
MRVPDDSPKPIRLSRRHFFKAVAVAVGAVAAPGRAHAQWDRGGSGGWGDGHPWGGGSGWGGGDPWHGGGGGDGGGGGGGGYHCFLRGTLIRAKESYRPIETLTVGETLPTRFSGAATIRKIISYTIHRDETGAWPEDTRLVRIGPGALGEGALGAGAPARGLFLTEAHAVFLDGVLVPIGSLVNGKTISFDDRAGPLDFFHVEFDSHDVIDAEGALCESRRDPAMEPCAPMVNFNGRRSEILSHLRSGIAPVIDRRRPLDRIRDRLEIRAGL